MAFVFEPSGYCQKWPSYLQKHFGACFRYTLHELKQMFWKRTKMTKFGDFLEIFTIIFFKFFSNFCFLGKKNQKNKNFWSWKIGFLEKKNPYWIMCKFVENRQIEKKITKIKSSDESNINPYPKCYLNPDSRGTMLVSIHTMFSYP